MPAPTAIPLPTQQIPAATPAPTPTQAASGLCLARAVIILSIGAPPFQSLLACSSTGLQ